MSIEQNEQRAAYIAGLRLITDAIEANPAMELPYDGDKSTLDVFSRSRESMAAWVALLDDPEERGNDYSAGIDWYRVDGRVGGVKVTVRARADQLGGRIVTREVASYDVKPFLPVSA